MAAIKAKEKKGFSGGMIAGFIVLFLAAGAGVYFGVIKPDLDQKAEAARLAQEQAERQAAEAAAARERAAAEAQARREAEEARAAAEQERQAALQTMTAVEPAAPTTMRRRRRPSMRPSSMMSGGISDDPLAGLDL